MSHQQTVWVDHWGACRALPATIVIVLATVTIAKAETNAQSIAVPLIGTSGIASPYPSTIEINAPGGPGQTGFVWVTLHNVTHPCPEDLAVLLVHNDSAKYLLMANAGGCRPLQGTTIRFVPDWFGPTAPFPDDDVTDVPYPAEIVRAPSVYGTTPSFPAPAPSGVAINQLPPLSVNLNGTWDLYVIDTKTADRGVIASGWSLLHDTSFESISEQANVTIPSAGAAASYPVTFDLSGAPDEAVVKHLRLRLDITHQFADDMRILLQSPTGTSVIVMANAGGPNPVPAFTGLVFDDVFTAPAPNETALGTTYQPGGAYATFDLPPPAPPPPYQTAFSVFDGQSVAGVWRLWIFDDSPSNVGVLQSATLTFWTEEFPSPSFFISAPTIEPTYTATQPFLSLVANIADIAGSHSATWRNVVDGVYFDSGTMTFAPPGTVLEGLVPLKKGTNEITVTLEQTTGSFATDTLTVSVSEFDYYLTEGATGPFFDTDITLANPGATPAAMSMTFLPEGGSPVLNVTSVPASGTLLVKADAFLPASATATVMRSTDAVPLAIERSMFWDATYYGGHGGTAVEGQSTRWLFAEGSQGFFDTFLLLANDNDVAATATVRYLREGAPPVVITPVIAPHSRLTIYAGDVVGLPGFSFGIDVLSSLPITAERAMYFPHDGPRLFEGGHESAGVTAPSRQWFLAEGATGSFFQCFVLVSNPNPTAANVQYTYLLPNGATVVKTAIVAANSRLTVDVETVDPLLANTAVSTLVTSDIGVVVERAMYWPDFSLGWQEAHNAFGVAAPGLRWSVADGRIGGPQTFDTYLLLANSNPVPAEVEVSFIRAGAAPVVKAYTIPATSRHSIGVTVDVPELGEGVFGAEIRVLNFQPIAVEKAMYWNSGGVVWAGGSDVTASRLPPP